MNRKAGDAPVWGNPLFMCMMGKKHKQKGFFRGVVTVVVVFGLFALCGNVSAQEYDAMTPQSVLAEINKDRIAFGLAPLRANRALQIAAQEKARDMVQRRYFSHNDPEGRKPWRWLERVGYDYEYAGENLAIGFVEPKSQNAAWMKSVLHRRNILSDHYTETGIAVVEGNIRGVRELVVVEFFARGRVVPVGRGAATQRAVAPDGMMSDAFGWDANMPQLSAVAQWSAHGSFASRALGALERFGAFVHATRDVWVSLFWTLFVAQFFVSLAVSTKIAVRIYRQVHTVDLCGNMR